MRKAIWAVEIAAAGWTSAVCAGILLTAMSARPVAAQGFGYAAVAVSPTTLDSGESSGTTSLASVGLGAVQACQSVGGKDCKVVYSGMDQCVALAIKKNPNTYAYGVGATREAAATSALAACKKKGGAGIECWLEQSPCANDNTQWKSPLPLPPGGSPGLVDPALVGFWKLTVNSGIWVWQVGADGTYTFHSEAPDGAPSHDGTFMTNNGHYTLHASSMSWDDQGTYSMQGSTAVVMTGKLGTGTWYRIAADPGYSERPLTPGPVLAPGITIRR